MSLRDSVQGQRATSSSGGPGHAPHVPRDGLPLAVGSLLGVVDGAWEPWRHHGERETGQGVSSRSDWTQEAKVVSKGEGAMESIRWERPKSRKTQGIAMVVRASILFRIPRSGASLVVAQGLGPYVPMQGACVALIPGTRGSRMLRGN